MNTNNTISTKKISSKFNFLSKTILFSLAASLISIFFLTGCPLEITITSNGLHQDTTLCYINTTAEKPVLELVSSFDDSTSINDARIFDTLEIEKALLKCGYTEPEAKSFKPNSTSEQLSISATASNEKLPFIKKHFTKKQAVSSFDKLEITLSPEILQNLITSQNSIIQKYADLLMAPCFTGEELTESEYRDLVASLYGNEIANELLRGKIKIIMRDGAAKQQIDKLPYIEIPLIEILTLQKEKTYVISR
ncbi:MAG: hypothetical protein KBS84_00840 [Treponema sp.]|nr:hypothetical protein [Candidatus Treponema scatequi]